MESYNVKDDAKLLGTSEETVRRWIRSGKLKASMDSRKGGSVITEAMLKEFVKTTPKYATAFAAPVGGLVAASALLLGTITTKNVDKGEAIKHSKINSNEVEQLLIEQKTASRGLIKSKKQMLKQLEKEIKIEEGKIHNIDYLLNELRKGEN